MKSFTAEMADLNGRLPEYPEPPPLTGLSESISVFVGHRSDQVERSVHPSTVFEMELDAEVQDISRQYSALQAEVDDYLNRHRKVARTRSRALYAAFGLLVVLCLAMTWLAQPKAAAPSVHATPDLPAVLTPLEPASATRPPVLAASTTAPAQAAAPTPASPLPAASSLAAARDLPGGRPVPSPQPALSTTPDITTPAKGQPAPNGKGNEKEAKIFALEETMPSKPEPATTSLTPVQAPAPSKKIVDPVVIKSEPVAKSTAKHAPSAESPSKSTNKAKSDAGTDVQGNTEPETTKTAHTEEGTKSARKDRYGSSGVVTLMPSGVVVFDVATKSQKMVPIGGKLPDGSVLKGVDAKIGRIRTDKGEVEYE